MKKILTLLLLLAGLLPARGASEEIRVVISGKYKGAYSAYKIGPEYYLSAKDAGALYRGQVYWYPVAGRVRLTFRGEALELKIGSDMAVMGGEPIRLDSEVITRGQKAFVPISLFLSEEFSAWREVDSEFNPRTGLLVIGKRSTVGPLRWFSYHDRTRIVLPLKKGLRYNATGRGVSGMEITVPLGVIESSQRVGIEDGVIAKCSLRQESKLSRLSIRFAQKGSLWRVRELFDPRRVVIEVFKKGVVGPVLDRKVAAYRSPAPVPREDSARTPPRRSKRRIVIDPGHGGKDPGATGRGGTREKDINLLAARQLALLLRQEDAFEVLLTRTRDKFVKLSERSRIANEFGADLFISLHCNASPRRRDSGFMIFILSEEASDPEAARLAEFENSVLKLEGGEPDAEDERASAILVAMAKDEHMNASSELAVLMGRALAKRVDIKDMGVRRGDFYILRGANSPAILHEMAFLSNRRDEARLGSAQFRRKIVDGLYAGVVDYAKRRGWLTQ